MNLRQGSALIHFDSKFRHFVESPDDGFDGGREDIIAADDEHVIHAPENPAEHSGGPTATGTALARHAHLIAGAIANDRRTVTAEIGDDEFTGLAFRSGIIRGRVEHFSNALGFGQVDIGGVLETFKTQGADFSHAGVIEHARVPRRFDALPRGGDMAARLTCDDEGAHRRIGDVDTLFGGDFDHADGVGRGATDDGHLIFQDHLQPCRCGHSTGGNDEQPQRRRRLEGSPESDKRAE